MGNPRSILVLATLTTFACGQPSSSGDPTGDSQASAANTEDGSDSAGATTGDEGTGTSPDVGGDTGTQKASAAFPVGLAVASPTASLGGPSGMPMPPMPMPPMPAMPGDPLGVVSAPGAVQGPSDTPTLTTDRHPAASASIESGKPYAVKQAELADLIAGVDCDLVLGPVGGGANPQCYGPSLDYQNHPDATMGMADGQLPGGDLGLWQAEDPSGSACAAAKLNSLVDEVALKVDYGLYLAANLQCLMVVEGVALPDKGAEIDRTDSVHDSLSATNAGVTVTQATIAREADEDGRSVFRYDIAMTLEQGGNPVEMTTTVRHAADLSDDADYRGQIWSHFDMSATAGPGGPAIQAYALTYAQDATGLRYDVQGAAYSGDSTDAADPYDAEGNLDFGTDWNGNATRATVELDPDTGSASLAFAWQAGRGDSHTRVFNVSVDFESPDHGAGCGFFGFGEPFSGSGPSDAAISTFICNWAGPGNAHAGEAGFAQKQCMETDIDGRFVATESRITYAPVNDCDTTDDPDFAYRLPSEADYSTDPLTRDLVELASDGDYASWSAPSAP